MNTKFKRVVFYTILTAFAITCILCLDKTFWRILLPCACAFVGYMVYEIDNAIEINEDEL